MASAFNICALIEHWRVEIPPGFGANESHGDDVRDPKWCASQSQSVSCIVWRRLFPTLSADEVPRLLAVNGLSLGFALISNFSLLLNMARRLSFPIAQPITIIGWYLSSLLLVGDIAGVIHIVKIPHERRALTQAYYYAIFAAVLYFIIATLMVITVYGAQKGHYSKEFKLNMSQRTLMLQTISFMIYMVGGAGVYAKIEGWMFLDAVYFTNYTLLTVGIGDYAPSTDLGRGLLFPYAIGGVVILGLVVGSIRSLVLERGKKKLGSRMVEKRRELKLQRLLKKGKGEKLNPVKNEKMASTVGMSERERRKEEFHFMRKIQQEAATRQKWTALLISGSAWFFLWFIGALVFYFAEHEQEWTYFQSLYFAYTTLLTIGYGDFKPFSNSGKAFFVFWSLLAVPTLTILISNMGDTIVKGIRDLTIWLGEFTVLPGEAGARQRVRSLAKQATGNKVFRGATDVEEPPGLLSGGKDPDEERANIGGPRAAGTDFLADKVQNEELSAAWDAKAHGDILAENTHYHHYLLIKEFRNVMKHLNESPPRKYSYDEWAWFLKLMGEDETSHASHRAPPIKVNNFSLDKQPDIAQGQTDDDEGKLRQWSWLGNRSPLMGETEEAEWVLERLSMTLEKELKKLSDAKSKPATDTQNVEDLPAKKVNPSNGSEESPRCEKG